MNTSVTDIDNLAGLLEDKIHHKYLEKYLKKPKFDKEKLRILTSLVDHKVSLNPIQKEQYVITAMLVQIALDTHELVPARNDTDETKEDKLAKQLRVLAGDYYSGLYYLFLSEIEDFDFIHTLATSIKKINEYKIQLYYKEVESLAEFIDVIKKIDSTVITHVTQHIYDDSSIHELIADWLLTDRLTAELSEAKNNGIFPLYEKWLDIDQNSNYTSFLTKMNVLNQETKAKINSSISMLPEKYLFLKNYVINRTDEMEFHHSSIVEEG
ncbi:heptaprenyl diphosphate synthase component 1 [Oceanobacillus damuensis]|uniref:heptaprenyl diphosphate synthase component 1 n=1 Tax=Oceanobacillus damuensis TaxID=937928 RepID=UPI00082B70C0|nr:heptaprenyl diphosphate synthase component 1 [Oceanobacillus damuensis]